MACKQELGSPPPTDTSTSSDIHFASAKLSPAQVSRAAAQAVRLCIKDGEFGNALYVVNSACQSVLQGPLQSSEEPKSQLEPIRFGQPVSPRLAAHAFLHGLIRGGYHKKASTYATLMIRAGIPIRTTTLESVVSSVLSRPRHVLQVGPFARVLPPKMARDSPAVLQLQRAGVSNECTRAALDLLHEARAFGQKRTERMYRTLIETLLLQGEILVASLLFVLLLKDFEIKQAQNAPPGKATTPENYITHEMLRISPPSPAALRHTPFPNPLMMSQVLETISSDANGSLSHDMAQSLALFAMLLDTGQIGHGRVAGLISCLYHFPRTDARVWILQDGKPAQVPAYHYFHKVLQRLIGSLTDDNPTPIRRCRLSLRSYHSLLTYALRHRLSPEMASTVLRHMCEVRNPPGQPNAVTFNILLRSGTLLQRMDISETAIAAFRATTEHPKLKVMFEQLESRRKEGSSVAKIPSGSRTFSSQTALAPDFAPRTDVPGFAGTYRLINDARFDAPDAVSDPKAALKADRYTFTSLVMHLTSTGKPNSIADSLFQIMPELALVEHPADGADAPAPIPRKDARKAMQRAVMYGPRVYSCLINALAKAREVGLAERVFVLGQRAERASRQPGFAPCRPWKLSKHSYTALMQAYADVVRKRVPRYKLASSYAGTTLLRARPRRSRKPEVPTIKSGYAQYLDMLHEQSREKRVLTKTQLCRWNAIMLYRSVMSGGKTLFQDLLNMSPEERRRLKPRPKADPTYEVKPDARFFNAALRAFAPAPKRIHPRRRKPAYFRRLWSRSLAGRRRDGYAAAQYSPIFCRVLRAIARRGFDVPLGYRHLLLGKHHFRVHDPRKPRIRSPLAFPRPDWRTDKIFELSTPKSRGLPVRRKTRKRLLRGRRRTAETCV
ncbi:hypothetical protein BN946_scf185043.g230 [Trametes cinnabarina]|uniref:Uncharacterized protein n=1 Tax=Pycnoporus cinnabarinus TaxID=5643 RepID=A0A060SPM4_PYCCI|nr:hypothetical protein BN946_scf185043.g230 [Trametes cinnabarina]